MSATVRLCAGLMSGTSVDAVDGALVAFPVEAGPEPNRSSATSTRPHAIPLHSPAMPRRSPATPLHSPAAPSPGSVAPNTIAFCSRPIPAALRDALQALQQPGHDELARAALAANSLAELYAEVVADLLAASGLEPNEIAAIGAHGQTVRHRPDLGYTIQLLNPARLAEQTGIAVVADLRSADVAAGGQGAPLVPGFHATVFAHPLQRRAIANLGGIANVSLLPASDENTPVLGFDTGPANTLLDQWCRRHTGEPFDRGGAWAAGGQVLDVLLARMLEAPYFRAPAPKSTGRDQFNEGWLDAILGAANRHAAADPRDVQATLAELTAITVAEPCLAYGAKELWVCGGGARNADLMRRLRRRAAPAKVDDTAALGIDPQAVEAMAFAWLAHRHLACEPGNVPAVTGATGPRVLGALWPASR